jgi:hypothetical protein
MQTKAWEEKIKADFIRWQKKYPNLIAAPTADQIHYEKKHGPGLPKVGVRNKHAALLSHKQFAEERAALWKKKG